MMTVFNQENLNGIDKLIIGGIDMWGNMMATQQLLENKYEKVLGIKMDSPELTEERMMALRDEVMEYAKTTKCFKYWSLQDEEPFMVRLEEFSDGIHFYLQQFLILGIKPEHILKVKDRSEGYIKKQMTTGRLDVRTHKRKVLTTLLNLAVEYLITPGPADSADAYKREIFSSFGYFMTAGYIDGFTDEDIEKGYYLKNRINQERLKSGY